MIAADAMFHLDAAERSVPEPIFPPDVLNSTVADTLRATRPFLDTDRDWIFSNIEGLHQQVSVYDTLLDRIDEIRSEVLSHQDTVHKSITSHSSILAPVRRLPIDVLKSVFCEMQMLQRQDGNFLALDLSQGPWTLSHVCGAWRDVVLSYPQLWSHIVLCFYFGYSRSLGHFAYRSATYNMLVALEAVILRSGQCPLDIVLTRRVVDTREPEGTTLHPSMTDKVIAMVCTVSHRWRTLMLRDVPLDLLERLKVVRGRIPCLESFTLRPSGVVDLPEDIRIIFDDAPCLRKVILEGIWHLENLRLPLHITHLAAQLHPSVSNLEIYQSLVECHLEMPSVAQINPDTSLAFLPNVRRLFVASLQALAHLCLPSLNELTITVGDSYSRRRIVQFVDDFYHRSGCSLTRLAFQYECGEIVACESFLSMDTLVCLDIRVGRNERTSLKVLASDRFLQNLQHLQLFDCMMPSSQHFVSAILACHGRHLRSVKVYCARPADVEIMNQQLALVQGPGQHFIAVLEAQDDSGWPGSFWGSYFDDTIDLR